MAGNIEKQQDAHHSCREGHDDQEQFQFAQRKKPAHQRETFAMICVRPQAGPRSTVPNGETRGPSLGLFHGTLAFSDEDP